MKVCFLLIKCEFVIVFLEKSKQIIYVLEIVYCTEVRKILYSIVRFKIIFKCEHTHSIIDLIFQYFFVSSVLFVNIFRYLLMLYSYLKLTCTVNRTISAFAFYLNI